MARKPYIPAMPKSELKQTGKLPLRDNEQELFCVLYTSNTTPRFFAHGQNCYAEAYGHQARLDEIAALLAGPKLEDQLSSERLEAEKRKLEAVCRSNASRLLTRPDIRKRCAHLFDSFIKYEVMDREQVYVALQRGDLQSKIRAIELYKKERGHFVDAEKKAAPDKPQKLEVTYRWKDPLPRKKDEK